MIKKNRAFSLLEISIVMTVIGFLVIGLMQGGELVRRAKVKAAAALTRSSPVSKIDGLLIWFETTMPASFSNAEAADGKTISTWYNIGNSSTTYNNATQATLDNQPTYTSGVINGLPVLRFNGSHFLSYNGTFLANSDYSIFIVEQRRSNKDNNYILAGTDTATNSNLHFGYRTNTQFTIALYLNDCNTGGTAIPSYTSPIPRIHSTTFSSNYGKNYYINGSPQSITCAAPKQALISYNNATIGQYSAPVYVGDIAEIIMFNRFLTDQERSDIETYLGKKWGITTP